MDKDTDIQDIKEEKVEAIETAAETTETSERSGQRGQRGPRRDFRGRNRDNSEQKEKEFTEKLIKVNRVSKTVKGGRTMSFSAMIVVGDQKGKIGLGFGKAKDPSEAIAKATIKAKANMFTVPVKNKTIPHEVIGHYKSASVLLRPACPGTGVIAGGAVRAVCDAAGITDILSKSLGSKNKFNTVKACVNGLKTLFDAKNVAKQRGKSLSELWG